MNLRISTHLLRLLLLILVLSLVLSTTTRIGGEHGNRALERAISSITATQKQEVTACRSEVESRMYIKYGVVGCLAAEQYGAYAELVFQTFWETDEFQSVVRVHGSMKVVPILLKALTHPNTFRLMEVEYQLRNAFAAALGSVASGFKAGKDAFNLGEKANEVFLAGIRELIQKSSQVHKAARPLEPQEFAFLLLYGMHSEGGSFLDQFHVLAVDQVETIYSEHAVHLLSSIFTNGIRTAETRYRFDRENFDWLKDGGSAALDTVNYETPHLWITHLHNTTTYAKKQE